MYEDQKKANKTRKLERRQTALAVAASAPSALTSQDQGMAVVNDDDEDDLEDYDDDDHEREGIDSRGGEVGSQRVENKERARDDAGNVG